MSLNLMTKIVAYKANNDISVEITFYSKIFLRIYALDIKSYTTIA